MSDFRFTDIEACVFDAYGTLFDIQAPMARRREKIGPKADELSALWRRKQLEYSWLRTLMGRHADFWRVTGDALDHAMAVLGLTDPVLRADLMQTYLNLDAYPDAKPMLEQVKAAGKKTAILSNGSETMLTAVVNRSEMTRSLDHVISVEERASYKPHPSVYLLAAEKLEVDAAHVCFVTANGWDAAGAAAFGFQVAWINRTGAPVENLPHQANVTITSLSDLPPLLGHRDS
ncbi:2-haloacid dehalogenase [Constrictibacter sp. MBR-5]|jgi:2-haloacid dehalogenase